MTDTQNDQQCAPAITFDIEKTATGWRMLDGRVHGIRGPIEFAKALQAYSSGCPDLIPPLD